MVDLLPPLLEGADLVGALSSRTVMLRSPRVWPGRRDEGEEEARVSVRVWATREGDRARGSTPTRIAREESLERASGRLEIIVTAGGSARAAETTRLRRDRARKRQKTRDRDVPSSCWMAICASGTEEYSTMP